MQSHRVLWVSKLLFIRVWATLSFQIQLSNYSTQPSRLSLSIHEAEVSSGANPTLRENIHTSGKPTHAGDVSVRGPSLIRLDTNASSLQHHLSLFLLTDAVSISSPQENADIVPSDRSGDRSGNSDNKIQSWNINSSKTKFERDEVLRVVDANTVKLKRNGLVSFAAVQTPSGYGDQNFRFPDCMTKSPSSKVRQLLPANTKVLVIFVEKGGDSRPRGALVEVESKQLLVNTQLVKEGFAKPANRGRVKAEEILPGISGELSRLEKDARLKGVGMFKTCDEVEIASDDQFEPLDVTTEIQWGDDGGKIILKQKDSAKLPSSIPPNPGDIRGCSDFKTYEDALKWYETFSPFYGDVAKLDRDGDGIPCSGLPHTQDKAKYRIKKPSATDNKSTLVE